MKDEMKKKVSGGVICGEIGYNELSPQEQHRITDALRKGVSRREFISWLMVIDVV